MHRKTHWETVYQTKPSDTVSWFEPAPTRSMALLTSAGLTTSSDVIDVGGGDSLLAGALLDHGVGHVTVLDISGAALARAQARLGDRAAEVTWIEGDITGVELPPTSYDLWHDRAVFHFLTAADDRAQYIAAAARCVRAGGALIIATFAPDGPTRCSGLEVVRYSPEDLASAFEEAFVLRHGFVDTHRTPGGAEQRFSFAVLSRR
jgi:ubiquinone/menaquinone biosynthesis C-methylase UbiE